MTRTKTTNQFQFLARFDLLLEDDKERRDRILLFFFFFSFSDSILLSIFVSFTLPLNLFPSYNNFDIFFDLNPSSIRLDPNRDGWHHVVSAGTWYHDSHRTHCYTYIHSLIIAVISLVSHFFSVGVN